MFWGIRHVYITGLWCTNRIQCAIDRIRLMQLKIIYMPRVHTSYHLSPVPIQTTAYPSTSVYKDKICCMLDAGSKIFSWYGVVRLNNVFGAHKWIGLSATGRDTQRKNRKKVPNITSHPPLSNLLNICQLLYSFLDSYPPSAAYMRRWNGSALVQIMACRLHGAKPLSKPILTYCQ